MRSNQIEKYTIKHPFLGGSELEIVSKSLYYGEIGETHTDLQCTNLHNFDLIHKKCREVSALIKEIDKLNRPFKRLKALERKHTKRYIKPIQWLDRKATPEEVDTFVNTDEHINPILPNGYAKQKIKTLEAEVERLNKALVDKDQEPTQNKTQDQWLDPDKHNPRELNPHDLVLVHTITGETYIHRPISNGFPYEGYLWKKITLPE